MFRWFEAGPQGVEADGDPRQLVEVGAGEAAEDGSTAGGEPEADDPAVVCVGGAAHETGGPGPVDELHDAVMPQEKRVGGVPDGRPPPIGMAAHGKQQLVLGPGQAGRLGLLLAPSLEPAEPCAKREQPLVITIRYRAAGHGSIVSRQIVSPSDHWSEGRPYLSRIDRGTM